jgi:hypothetical protein
MVGRMLNALIRRAAEGDWEALEALSELEELSRLAMTAGLMVAREHYSLAQLGQVVGTGRTAVHNRTNHPHALGTPDGCGHPVCVGMRLCRLEATPVRRAEAE